MKKILKIVILYCLFFCSFSLSAQNTLEEYMQAEKNRLEKVKAIELEINIFVDQNLSKYRLNKTDIEEIYTHFKNEGEFVDIDNIILEANKSELRKLYFEKFPENNSYYFATILPDQFRLNCINGGFEEATDLVLGYNFFSSVRNYVTTSTGIPPVDSSLFILGCETLRDIIPTSTTINGLNTNATVISSVDPGYVQFDPTLNTPARGFIQVPTISPNGGNHSIKLNASGGGWDVTTMSKDVTIGTNDTTIDYEFSLLLQDSGTDHTLEQKPTFRVDLIVDGNVVNTRCINAEPNCIFQLSHADGYPNSQDIYYSGWRCDQIDVTNYRGHDATLVFTITDCFHGGHLGTVYIDNICNYTCPNPVYGALITNPLNTDCPDMVNNTSYQICGSFSAPLGAVLNNIAINISQNGGVFTPIPNSLLNINGTNFCFLINPSVFGNDPSGNNYQFQVIASYTQDCNGITVDSNNTTYSSVTFNNCCQANATLTSPSENVTNLSPFTSANPLAVRNLERQNWIKATNIISIGDNAYQNGVVYHAGDFIVLNPGFVAVYRSQFDAYILGCTGSYVYKQGQNQVDNQIPVREIKSDLIKLSRSLEINPNPSSNSIEILMRNGKFNRVYITSIDGKILLQKDVDSSNNLSLDISNYEKGIYIVNVTSDDGKQFSQKLIKN